MSQKTHMCFHATLHDGPTAAEVLRALVRAATLPRRLFAPLLIGALVLMAGLAYGRSPVSNPMQDLEFQREIMAGSDALLERMVIPPNRPDWLLTDCTHVEATSPAAHATSYDRMRHALCEAARKSNVAIRN